MDAQLTEIILERLKRIEEKQDQTLYQTTKTNGRVTRLEEDSHELWKDMNEVKAIQAETKGKNKVIWIILCCVGVLCGYIINSLLK